MTLPVSPHPIRPFEARDYQTELVEAARQRIRQKHKRILIQLPTGGGKTVIAALIIEGALAKDKRILFLAHRRELIEQPSAKLDQLGVSHGIVMAQHHRYRPYAPVQVASIQTLANRELAYPPDLIFIDEAHRARAATYGKILERYPDAVVIGLTATPVRSDGRGLGNLFQTMACGPSVATLTERGYLVPTRVFAPTKPDLKDVGKVGGDYNQGQLGRTMDRSTITGDIVEHWRRLGEDRLTICFAVNVEHSKHLCERFREAGVRAAHLDGETPLDERTKLLEQLAAGEIRVLCSVGVLTEGWDCPAVSCAILARPTTSEGLYLQMAGRILRPAPGKADALILDHAGCTWEHGFVDDERTWTLERDRMAKAGPRIDVSLKVKACPQCYRVWSKSIRQCVCGYIFYVADRGPEVVAGSLQEAGSDRRAKYTVLPEAARKVAYMRWARETIQRGYKKGYPAAKYHEMFREWPPSGWQLEASLKAREWEAEVSGELVVPAELNELREALAR